jgi:hypothetical protein
VLGAWVASAPVGEARVAVDAGVYADVGIVVAVVSRRNRGGMDGAIVASTVVVAVTTRGPSPCSPTTVVVYVYAVETTDGASFRACAWAI